MSSTFTELGLSASVIGSLCSTCLHVDPMQPKSSYPLRRGKACLVCRALKIKCDGVRPVCGSCQRKPKANKCDWDNPHNRSRVAILIETVKLLEARILELEHPELVAPVTLHYPYRRDQEEFLPHLSAPPDAQTQFHNSAFPMANLSSDSYWETTTNASVSSTPLSGGESFTRETMEFEYGPAFPPSASAPRYYQYQRNSGLYTANSLVQPRHT